MKIAISGTHRTGKTTLIERLVPELPRFKALDEPYWILVQEGHEFAAIPDSEDFELQLERSLELIAEKGGEIIFDRCPADIFAYLLHHRDSKNLDLESWLPRIRAALEKLDLIVYVPVEEPDRILLSDPDDDNLRKHVDEGIRELLSEFQQSIETEILEVAGNEEDRVRQVVNRVEHLSRGA